MESNMSFFSLPFVDSETTDLDLPSHSGLLGSDDVLAQFLTADGPLEEPDLNGPTTLHCEICQKRFDNAKKYYGHLRIHSKDNDWICDKCPEEKFPSKQALMKHCLTHKPLARVWKCLQCTMAFEALWRLQQHVFAIHLHYRSHKCDQCDKSFHKLSDLKKHQDIHNKMKNFACTFCGKKFSDKSNLKRHTLLHSKIKPFVCTGCQNRFTQLASLKRHQQKCNSYISQNDHQDKSRKNYCRVCGATFQYKSALLEHYIRQHTTNTEEQKEVQTNESNIDMSRTEDNIVDDILSAEDDYMAMSTQQDLYNQTNAQSLNMPDTNTYDSLMQIEFLKEMNQLRILDDEILYNDLDFDSLQNSHIFNSIAETEDFTDRNEEEILFDFHDVGRSEDQDIGLGGVKPHLPDELLNVDHMNTPVPSEERLQTPTVSVNECATIFERDVDLEESTNLAANLNQLIGENSVHYIATEDDDMFIISLKSEMDAEKLTDLLNIDVKADTAGSGDVSESEDMLQDLDEKSRKILDNIQPFVISAQPPAPVRQIKIEVDSDYRNVIENDLEILESGKDKRQLNNSKVKIVNIIKHENIKEGRKDDAKKDDGKKGKHKQSTFVCKICNKTFNKKDNCRSHVATHSASLRRHRCSVCGERFSYRSSLNKHRAARHEPRVQPAHACALCDRVFPAQWLVSMQLCCHLRQRPTPRLCGVCGERFSYRSSLNKHRAARHEPRVQPAHACALCDRVFPAQWLLKHHKERDHDQLKPYKCDEKDCNKSFYKNCDLVIHKRSHTGEKPFKCEVCNKAYQHVSHLHRHERSVDCTRRRKNLPKLTSAHEI